jgi:hypothetical protein
LQNHCNSQFVSLSSDTLIVIKHSIISKFSNSYCVTVLQIQFLILISWQLFLYLCLYGFVHKQTTSINLNLYHCLYPHPINYPIIPSILAIGVYAGLHPFASLAADQPFVCVLTAHPAKVIRVQYDTWYDICELIVYMNICSSISSAVLSCPVLSHNVL